MMQDWFEAIVFQSGVQQQVANAVLAEAPRPDPTLFYLGDEGGPGIEATLFDLSYHQIG